MVVGDPQNKIKYNLVTHIILKYYYYADFGDPPVEKYCSRSVVHNFR